MNKHPTFNELVDEVAGDALTSLIKGQNWRSIIYTVCDRVAAWSYEEHKGKSK